MSSRKGARHPKPFTLEHFKVYASHLILDNGEPWRPEPFQLDVLRELFAGFPEVWMVVPEGNGKTTMMGALSLYHGDYTPTASVLLAASSRDQCEVLFQAAAGFVHRSPALKGRFKVFDGYRRVKCLRTGGRVQVFAADDRTGDGVIPTLALLDELHRHKDMRLYRTWRGKLDKRGGQLVAISTAGEPDSEFEDIRCKVRREAQVTIKGSHLRAATEQLVLHDWSVPLGDDLDDMAVVKAANPLKSITKPALKRKRSSPTMTVAHWRRFVCNQAVRLTESAIDDGEWRHAAGAGVPAGEPVAVGVDLGWKWDTTAIVPLWMESHERRVIGRPEILTPPRDGTSLSPREVEDAFRRIDARNPIGTVVMDPSAGGEQLASWLEDEIGADVISYPQGPTSMATAYERFMEALRNGWLEHPDDPAFTRHVLNATAKLLPDGRSRFDRPSRSRNAGLQDYRVIDALIAAAMVNATLANPAIDVAANVW